MARYQFSRPAQRSSEIQKEQNKLKKKRDDIPAPVKVRPIQRGLEKQEMFTGRGTGLYEYRGIPGDEKGTSQGPNMKESQGTNMYVRGLKKAEKET